MRPTASAMLQQNNNNNYPCLSMSASTQEMLQKCSKASLPLPGRLELSLGDLPLIRGLRAWALCSKNRRRTGNLLEGGREAPGPSPPSASCPRPADVHLSREYWGLGMDARHARIGALVTVATLKTSEGGGQTQTQCLFLRTEKGSCLYSTRKPGSAIPPARAKGWLGGETGGKDSPAGRRDAGAATSLHAEANWVRVRSGRRWRKSGNVSDVNRARQQRSKDGGDGLRLVEKRQDEQRKGNLDLQELAKQEDQQSLEGGVKSNEYQSTHRSSSESFHVGTKRDAQSEKELQTSPNKDVHSPKHEDTNHDALRFLSGNEDPPPVSTEKLKVEDKTCGAATNGSSSVSDGDGLRLAGERQDDQRKGNLDHQELEKCLEGGIESHESPQSFHIGTKREAQSEKELQTSPNKDVHSPKHKDTNHDALRFLSGNKDPPLDAPVSTEKPNAEDEIHGGATQEEISYCAEGKEEHESMSSSMSSESSEFGQNEPDVSVVKETQDESQRFSSKTEVSPSPDERRGCTTAQPIHEQETQDELEPDEDERTCRTLIKDNGGGGERRERRTQDEETKLQKPAEKNQEADTELCGPPTSHSHSWANPATFPTLPLSSLPVGSAAAAGGGGRSLGSQSESEETTTSTVAFENAEEEEFGVFIQADGEVDWDQGLRTPVHCGSRESMELELGNPAPLSEESSHWTPAGCMDGSFHQWDDSWTAFSQDASEKGGDVGQWWPISAAEQRRGVISTSTNQDLTCVFAQAFPSLSSSQCDSSVPTLGVLLRGGARHDQGLLDGFHDLDKMIGRRFKRANAASRDQLLRTLQMEPLKNENRHPASRRHSPGLPSANQHAHSAVPKRRLSYDSNRNVTA
ncbi:uncharacterized protein LOC114474496 isoform X1 [Gouania willdenowi]|uniref:uncharacterized protein LOC114474496 isoform X1 n=1 Tax=Gouania willdenowi TaxID=441366 RepID=UPI0010550092|nr:uncharacterized protein LOC114474496 isoform X1 [Gouania willdenowi]XP_028320666.1 uncharacterized protein LOC114474496 isoform X1 [Gouania willdenowi]